MRRRNQTEESVLKKIIEGAGNSRERLAVGSVTLGMGDDATLFRAKSGYETVLTCDWFLEATHFLRDKHPPDAVGWKCLARAISDVAAMGAAPRCFLLSLALPGLATGRWLDEFLSGLRRAAKRFRCVLAGGDTTQRSEILINVTVVGEVLAGRAAPRSGARAGDLLYVSGRLGEAELGLQILKQTKGAAKARNQGLRKHLYPEPRLAVGQWLAENRVATAMMDLSDGLSTDLARLCAASGVGAQIEEAKLPLLSLPKNRLFHNFDAVQAALHGGDDYELLFAVSRNEVHHLPRKIAGIPITCIGKITRKGEIVLVRKTSRQEPLSASGWDPFAKA